MAKLDAQKISTCLWFDNQAEEAAKFYISIFKKKSKVKAVLLHNKASPGKPGEVLAVTFDLAGRQIMALNGGPIFKFNPAISLVVHCKNQKEVDYYWKKLLEGGKPSQCGWLEDKYGVSWQIVPTELLKLQLDKSLAVREAVMAEMMKQVKLEVKPLKRAAKDARKSKGKKR